MQQTRGVNDRRLMPSLGLYHHVVLVLHHVIHRVPWTQTATHSHYYQNCLQSMWTTVYVTEWRPSACLFHSQHATGLLLMAQQVEDIHQPLHRAAARRAAAMWVVSRLQLR